MKYKITFVKIAPDFEFAGVGFAGNIFITLNALAHINYDDILHVDMKTNKCVCTETIGENCWENYFDQIEIEEGEEHVNFTSLLGTKLYYEDKDMFLYPENFTWLKNKFYNSFKIKENITNEIEKFYKENIKNKVTLGVQVRLTDMKHHHNVSPIEKYVEKINVILEENKNIQQIFLATDDSKIIPILKSSLKTPIIFYNDMFRADENNLHLNPYDRFSSNRKNHKYILGVECLKEILTLSKCDYMLKADVSSISIIATILSENLKKVYKV